MSLLTSNMTIAEFVCFFYFQGICPKMCCVWPSHNPSGGKQDTKQQCIGANVDSFDQSVCHCGWFVWSVRLSLRLIRLISPSVIAADSFDQSVCHCGWFVWSVRVSLRLIRLISPSVIAASDWDFVIFWVWQRRAKLRNVKYQDRIYKCTLCVLSR